VVRFVPLWAISHPGSSLSRRVGRLARPAARESPPANSWKKATKKAPVRGRSARRPSRIATHASRARASVRTRGGFVGGGRLQEASRAHPRPDAPRTRSRRALDAAPARFRRREKFGESNEKRSAARKMLACFARGSGLDGRGAKRHRPRATRAEGHQSYLANPSPGASATRSARERPASAISVPVIRVSFSRPRFLSREPPSRTDIPPPYPRQRAEEEGRVYAQLAEFRNRLPTRCASSERPRRAVATAETRASPGDG
jgi:hypothetical protein